METFGLTTSEALDVMEDALASINDEQRLSLSGPELVVLVGWIDELQNRIASLVGVLTDEATRAQESSASPAHVSPC
ncbi:hypothetical protein [Tessaracoccus antarcticus]|uniref:Uncharacterized protein n=1 Tax=Tessaracoccus antarcticus TaxID=2479848 RepID=A0A3M0G583_9ACTN|nr:hypothetical protein [Tessaracoccus antarcticus]RMB60190.1 hypothetical protein EAX62_10940 [Tessaracoccus antarcticus]